MIVIERIGSTVRSIFVLPCVSCPKGEWDADMGAGGRGGRRWIGVGQGSGFLFYKARQMEYDRHTGGWAKPHFAGKNTDSGGMEAKLA